MKEKLPENVFKEKGSGKPKLPEDVFGGEVTTFKDKLLALLWGLSESLKNQKPPIVNIEAEKKVEIKVEPRAWSFKVIRNPKGFIDKIEAREI